MHVAYLGIGSNLGYREENCKRAIGLLEKAGIKVTNRSSMRETDPWGVKDQPKFINMAIEIETSLRPHDLLALLKKIEDKVGRKTSSRWGPREIDLDILFYNETVLETGDLIIPHPGIEKREFVLKPLADIAPDLVHPVFKKRISEMLREISQSIK
jgi:2-amino-4-hydroxy-6-hydroxymethyldihydropteridine diphosphokinase